MGKGRKEIKGEGEREKWVGEWEPREGRQGWRKLDPASRNLPAKVDLAVGEWGTDGQERGRGLLPLGLAGELESRLSPAKLAVAFLPGIWVWPHSTIVIMRHLSCPN